jgi:putative hemolysin
VDWSEAGILVALILLNGVFAGSELALVSARKTRLKARARQGHHGARIALRLLDNPTRLLSTVQIGITLVGILTGVYSGAVFAEDLAVILRRFAWLEPYADETAFTLVVVAVTYLSLILGELVPKRIALAHAEVLAEVAAIPMDWISRAAWPLVWLLQQSTEAVTRLLPTSSAPQASITEDELRTLVAEGAREGVFQRREKELIEGVLQLADRSIDSIMTQRNDIIWLDSHMSLELMWREARGSGHAAFPICEGRLEHMMGIITLADLGEALRLGALDPAQHVREPLHVAPTISPLRLLDLFRSTNMHVAVVTGEYGEIRGLVTLVDILKAIAGTIGDAGSQERSEAVRRDDGSWLLDGQIAIHEVEQLLDRTDMASDDNFNTIGGFILWHLGRLPGPGDILEWRDLRVEVVDLDGTRIDKVLISAIPATDAGENSQGAES